MDCVFAFFFKKYTNQLLKHQLVYVRHVDSSTLAFSLSSHRLIHKFCLQLSLSRFIINNTISSVTLVLSINNKQINFIQRERRRIRHQTSTVASFLDTDFILFYHSVYEVCRSLNFRFQSFITPTLIYKSLIQFSFKLSFHNINNNDCIVFLIL